MFYMKNVPNLERAARVIVGIAGTGFAIYSMGTSTVGLLMGASAAGIALTGLFGFCPMCALVGRKLNKE
jgi:hypothetical protein